MKKTKTTKTDFNINDIKAYLKTKYKEIPKEWNTILSLLEDNIILYDECKESIRKNGIYDPSTGRKNPLLATLKDLQATMLKEIQHLGLSPYAASKIKDANEDDTDEFLEALTNGE